MEIEREQLLYSLKNEGRCKSSGCAEGCYFYTSEHGCNMMYDFKKLNLKKFTLATYYLFKVERIKEIYIKKYGEDSLVEDLL